MTVDSAVLGGLGVNVKDHGALGDGSRNDAGAIERGAAAALQAGLPLVFPGGTYRVNTPIVLDAPEGVVHWVGLAGATIMSRQSFGAAFSFSGGQRVVTSLAANAPTGSRRIVPADVEGIAPGDLIALQSDKAWYHDPRPPVGLVDHNTGTAQGGSFTTIVLDQDSLEGGPYAGESLTIIAGTGAGQARRIVDYDDAAKVATVHRPWITPPDATSRYVVPQAFKGELHRVADVEGDKLQLHAPLWDGYDVLADGFGDGFEEVRLTCYRPVTVKIEDLAFEWVPSRGNLQMIRVFYGSRCQFSNVAVRHARGPGIQMERCYDCVLDDVVVEGASGKYTGYGVVTQCASFIEVNRGRFWGCRRGVDWSSTYNWVDPYPSRGCRVTDSVNFGGGFRQDGRSWGPWAPEIELPEDTIDNLWMIDNFGFGSHGPADQNEYINNRVLNCHTGIIIRGRSERAEGNRFYGRIDYPFKVWFGSNHVIRDNHYVHPSAIGEDDVEGFYTEFRSFDSTAWNTWMPHYFVQVSATKRYHPTGRGYLDITGNTVRAVRSGFLHLVLGGADEWCDINMRHNHVTVWPADPDEDVYFVNSNNRGLLRRMTDVDNRIVVQAGHFRRYRSQNPIDWESCVIVPEGPPQLIWAVYGETEALKSAFVAADAPDAESGTEILAATAKPTYRGSRFRCRVELSITRTDGPGLAIAALFRGPYCIAARAVHVPAAGQRVALELTAIDAPLTDVPQDYSVRVGPEAGRRAAVRVNGDAKGRPLLGGMEQATLMIEELSAS